MRSLDLSNQVFGELTAKFPETIDKKRGWHCLCSCGKTKWIPTFQLTSGNNTTCGDGLHKQSIMVGDTFGQLTVQRIYRDLKNSRYMAECLCTCGQIKPNASFRNLQRGATTHCGCNPGKRQPTQSVQVTLRNALIHSYKGNARAKGLDFTLTVDECEELFQAPCYFCGIPPAKDFTKKPYQEAYRYSSIDRIDSSQGYVPSNVASCCTPCNMLKSNQTNDEFLAHIHRIASHQGMVNPMGPSI